MGSYIYIYVVGRVDNQESGYIFYIPNRNLDVACHLRTIFMTKNR